MAWFSFIRWFHHTDGGREHEDPQHACDHGSHCVGDDQQGLVDHGKADDAIRKDGQSQRNGNADAGHQHGEQCCALEGIQIGGVGEQLAEVVQANPFGTHAERVFHLE